MLFLSPSVLSGKEAECDVSDFESVSKRALGEGAFGQVYKVRHITTGSLYAIKMISKSKIIQSNLINQLRREIRIMYSLNHPYIIKLYNHFEDEKNFYLILQLAEGGSLFNKLVKIRACDEKSAAQYLREVALAVQYLHTRDPPIIHRDIKPENIFLDKDGSAKLGDFGWSCCSDNVRSTYCGTLEYLAPEMIDRSGHDTRLDLWNLGILLFELLTGNAPFQSNNQEELFGKIKGNRIGFPKNFPMAAKDLVKGLLKPNPSERITISELLNHPWVTQNPSLRKTCEMTTVTEKLPEDTIIPDDQYKVISKTDNSKELLLQEKILSTQLMTKVKKCDRDLYQMEAHVRRLQDRYAEVENENSNLQGKVTELNMRILSNNLYQDDEDSKSQVQEDLDDKIVKIQVKLRKIEFEIRLKNKEAVEKRKYYLAKEINSCVAESLLAGLKSYGKELKWLLNMNKSNYFLQEFRKITEMINDEAPDNIVEACLKELRVEIETNPVQNRFLEEHSDLLIQKTFKINELEEQLKEVQEISKLKTDIYQKLLPKKFK